MTEMNLRGNQAEHDLDILEKQEEILAQKEELTAAIEELARKNHYLTETLHQLQKKNDELDQLLYRTSHDLKSPLASLQGLLHLLKTEKSHDQFNTIVSYMEQKLSLMTGVLKSLSMLDSTYFEKIEWKEISLKPFVDQVIFDLQYIPNFNDVTIHMDDHGIDRVKTDELVLYNILKCLLSNAITFRDSLVKGNVYLQFDRINEQLIVEITDDGEGISSEIGTQIFDMFFRGSERSIGAGLGLYIVRNILDRVKGDIRWVSKTGRTTFQVILPEPH